MATKKRAPRATSGSAATTQTPFPVVGIGASAGGLAAIEAFLAAMPSGESLRMALVVVQHLDPDHKSLLLDLVKRYTDMDVKWAEDVQRGTQVDERRDAVLQPGAAVHQ